MDFGIDSYLLSTESVPFGVLDLQLHAWAPHIGAFVRLCILVSVMVMYAMQARSCFLMPPNEHARQATGLCHQMNMPGLHACSSCQTPHALEHHAWSQMHVLVPSCVQAGGRLSTAHATGSQDRRPMLASLLNTKT